MIFRKAKLNDLDILNELAINSESYWGENSTFLEKFKKVYIITPRSLNNSYIIIMEKDTEIVGFYSLDIKKRELDYLYIKKDLIRQGLGKKMWKNMLSNCKKIGLKMIYFVTSPEAAGFYVSLGAKEIGEVESKLRKGKFIPKLKYEIM
ncbi:MAG: GNAT family N-acetyltransferase [Bacillota bacterium]